MGVRECFCVCVCGCVNVCVYEVRTLVRDSRSPLARCVSLCEFVRLCVCAVVCVCVSVCVEVTDS